MLPATCTASVLKTMYNKDDMLLIACIEASFLLWFCISLTLASLFARDWVCTKTVVILVFRCGFPLSFSYLMQLLNPVTVSHRCFRQTQQQTQNDSSSWVTLWRKQSWITSNPICREFSQSTYSCTYFVRVTSIWSYTDVLASLSALIICAVSVQNINGQNINRVCCYSAIEYQWLKSIHRIKWSLMIMF